MKNIQKLIVASTIAVTVTSLFAGNMPFPQNKDYGTLPTGSPEALAAAVETQYNRYVDTWYKSQGYVYSTDTHNDGQTVSEAHGYGMIIFAIMDDQTRFDDMFDYYESNKTNGNLMVWKIGGGWTGGSATDGDLDIAYALLLADHQWGGNGYLSAANSIIDDIRTQEMNSDNMPTLGSNWEDDWIYRPSDWMAGHFRAFADVDDASTWNTAATKVYDNYWYFQDQTPEANGLISDFVSGGEPSAIGESSYDGEYYYNACRVPLRFAMDYARNKNTANTDALTEIMDALIAANGGDANDMNAGYNLDGSEISSIDYNGLEFLAPYGAGLIAMNDQSLMNNAWDVMRQPWTTTSDTRSFGDALKLLSMIVMTGNWWTPGDNDTYVEPVVNTDGVLLENFGNGFGDDNAQTYLGAANGVAWGDANIGSGAGDTTYFAGGGYWYAYAGGGAVKSASGTEIGENNADDIVTDNRLDVTFEVTGGDESQYGYAALEVPLLNKVISVDSTEEMYVDISGMAGITINYKSSGALKLVVATKDERETVTPEDGWVGSYYFDLPAQPSMTQITLSTADLKAEGYSPLETAVNAGDASLTGLADVVAIAFNLGEDEDNGASVDLQVEDIIIAGMDYSDLFSGYRDPSTITTPILETNFAALNQNNWSATATTAGVSIQFTSVQQANATVTLFSLAGQQVAVISGTASTGVNNLELPVANLASGMYLVQLNVNEVVSTQRISILN